MYSNYQVSARNNENQASLRSQGDSAIASGDLRAAMDFYKESIVAQEEKLLYSFVNLANLLTLIPEAKPDEIIELLIKALDCRDTDISYFRSSAKRLCFYLFMHGLEEESSAILTLAGFRKIVIREDSHFFYIPGFPRCGTTTIAATLVNGGLACDSLSQEPYTQLLGRNKGIEEEMKIVRNSYWSSTPLMQNETVFIDKSTHWLLNKAYSERLASISKNATILICTRKPAERALSAYKYGRDIGMVLSLKEAIDQEMRLVQDLGGISAIYGNKETFDHYLDMLGRIGIKLPILYPSLVMTQCKSIAPAEIIEKASFFDIDTKEFTGKAIRVDIPILVQSLGCHANKSTTQPVQGKVELEIISAALKDLVK